MTKEQEGVKLISFRLCCIVFAEGKDIFENMFFVFFQTIVKVRTIF